MSAASSLILLFSKMNQKSFPYKNKCNVSGILNFHCCCYLPPFLTKKKIKKLYYLDGDIAFNFCNFHLSHLQPVNNSLSILISYGQQLQHCAELLRNNIDDLWQGVLQLQHDSPQTLLLPSEEGKAEFEDAFQIWLWRGYIHFWFSLSNLFIVENLTRFIRQMRKI